MRRLANIKLNIQKNSLHCIALALLVVSKVTVPVCAKKECANYFSSSDPGPDTYLSLVSDMSSGNIYGIIFWHSIWQSI